MDPAEARATERKRNPLLMVLQISILVAADASAILLAACLAAMLRFDTVDLAEALPRLNGHIASVLLSLPVYIAVFAAFRLYRFAWRFVGLYALIAVVLGCTVGYLTSVALDMALAPGGPPQLAWLTISWLLGIFLVGSLRVALRVVNMVHQYGWHRVLPVLFRASFARNGHGSRRIVILGGGPDAARLLTSLIEDTDGAYQVVGLLDDNPQRHGAYIRFAKVLGPLSKLGELLAEQQVDEVFVAMSNANSGSLNQCLTECRRRRIPVYAVPTLQNVLEGKTLLKTEEIRLEDLLRRQPFRADLAGIGGYLTDKRVLVTGAGGSIGSELCRQIAAMNPAALLLMGHGENSIDRIHRELCVKFPGLANRLQMVIASVSDARRIEEVVARYRPHVVFHAAAHKHVPIMQVNVSEAIRNNVLGTQHVGESCGRHGVETMVLISTDKAVYPSNVMGATKWVCEQLLCAMASEFPSTKYVTVRFGNVLGSRGSVVPIFEEQIARKGPVTVTHDEMTRYFMTIPEAVQLVLQAGVIGRSGDLYLLDMGPPVRIMDLAEDMIRLHGYTREDIPIIITGAREGEKLHEKLVMEDEELVRDADGLWLVQRGNMLNREQIREFLAQIRELSHDEERLFEALVAVVPREGERQQLRRPIARKRWLAPLLGEAEAQVR